MTAPKIIVPALSLTIAIAVASAAALATSGDQAAPAPAASVEAAPSTGARASTSSSTRTRGAAPTTTTAAPGEAPTSPWEVSAQVAPEVVPDDSRPNPEDDRRVSGAFDLTPLPHHQNGESGHDAADSFAAAPSCSHQCITKGVAYAHGNDVEIVVQTSVPAQIYISVVATIDGEEENWADWTSFGETSHSWVLEDLVPGVTYYVMAAATDDNYYTSYAWGEFTLP